MKHGFKCNKCGHSRVRPHRAPARVAGDYSVRVLECEKCKSRMILVSQIATPELANKVLEEIESVEL